MSGNTRYLIAGLLLHVTALHATSQTPAIDLYGDPLPSRALARLGTIRFRHDIFVYHSAAFSHDGKTVASSGRFRGVALWDVATGKRVRDFPDTSDGPVAFSPDGKALAGGNAPVRLWDVATWKEIRRFKGNYDAIAFSADGKMIAGVADDRSIRVWDVETGKELRQWPLENYAFRVAFCPRGKILATAEGKAARLWDVASGTEVRRLEHKGDVIGVAYSVDGSVIATGSDDGALRLWSAESGKELRVLIDKQGVVAGVSFSHDGKLLAARVGGEVRLWEVASWNALRRWQAHAGTYGSVSFSRDDKMLASTAPWDSGPRLWEVATGKELHSFEGHRGKVDVLTFSRDGKTLVSASQDKSIRVWNWASAQGTKRIDWISPHFGGMALAANLGMAAATEYNAKRIRLWALPSGTELQAIAADDTPRVAVFSPDGKMLAWRSGDHRIVVWDVAGRKELRRFDTGTHFTTFLVFSPDGKILASDGFSREEGRYLSRFWNIETAKEALQVPSHGSSIAFAPDGKSFAVMSSSGIVFREAATGREIHSVQATAGTPVFSWDGRLLATASLDLRKPLSPVHVWEVATGREVCRFEGQVGGVWSTSFAPDGRTLASGGGDSTILIWDLTGRMKDGRLQPAKLTPGELDSAWTALADPDAAKAQQGVWSLVAASEQAVVSLQQKLRPVPAPDHQRIEELIKDLGSERFAMRTKAMQALEKFEELAEPVLRKAQAENPPLEMARRIEQLLSSFAPPIRSPKRLQELRAVQALEYSGTAEAQRLLESLAKGTGAAALTREAQTALARLKR